MNENIENMLHNRDLMGIPNHPDYGLDEYRDTLDRQRTMRTPQQMFNYLLHDGVSLAFAIVVADEKPPGTLWQHSQQVWLVNKREYEGDA